MTMPPRILIAEDDEAQSALLCAAMAHRGYETVAVSNGMDALRRLRQENFDIALLDYHLPEVDGLAAAQLLRDFKAKAGNGKRHARLIALTATAELLEQRQDAQPEASFDAVVSKRQGLPMLMTVIDDHLAIVAQHRASAEAASEREAAFHRSAQRRRRMAAPLAAIPALAISVAFGISFLHTSHSLTALNGTVSASHQVISLQHSTGGLVSAMDRMQLAQQSYLATGAEQDKARFYSEAEQLDRLMSSPESLQANGQPGMDANGPQKIIDPLVQQFSASVETRAPLKPIAADKVLPLRRWAAGLVEGSEQLVLRGLDVVRDNIYLALAMFGIGAAYGLWNAIAAFRRRWHSDEEPLVSMKAASSFDMPIARRLKEL